MKGEGQEHPSSYVGFPQDAPYGYIYSDFSEFTICLMAFFYYLLLAELLKVPEIILCSYISTCLSLTCPQTMESAGQILPAFSRSQISQEEKAELWPSFLLDH